MEKTYSKMNPKIKKIWIKWLRSGKYRQGRHCLHKTTEDDVDEFCCLGVLADACVYGEWVRYYTGEEFRWKFFHESNPSNVHSLLLSESILKECGLNKEAMHELINMNDSGCSFKKIADWIDKNL